MKPWTISFEEWEWTDAQARTAHVVAVAEMVGDGWDALSPWSGPRALAAWLAVLIAGTTGDLDAAVTMVYGLPVAALAACLDERIEPATVEAVEPTLLAA